VEEPSPGLLALAEAMKARIEAMELTTLEIAARGGPGRSALREIINARREPRPFTLDSLDKVLCWPAGLAKDVLEEKCPPPDAFEWLDTPDNNRLGMIRSHLVALRKEHYTLSERHKDRGDLIGELLDLIDAERR
jgi:hypothetical protein